MSIEHLLANIDYRPKDETLFLRAMTHKSYSKQNGAHALDNNERLEFLGDAVVDMVVGDILFDMFPDDTEGNLSRKRASLVNEDSLYNLAMRLKLDETLLVSENDHGSNLRTNKRLLAGALEAVIGAIFKDGGYPAASAWITELYRNHVNYEFSEHDFAKDYKTRFQEMIQEKLKVTPVYELAKISGPDHQKQFTVHVLVNGQVYGEGTGDSKKEAAQLAAEAALKRMGND